MDLLLQLLIGSIMIGLTVMIHAIGLDFILKYASKVEALLRKIVAGFYKPVFAGLIVVSVFAVNVIHIWLWAILYLALGCKPLQNLSESLYFATVTYTTLGYGDILLEVSYRMLSAIEAANGFILFGWTTAFIFEVKSRLYRGEARSI